MLITLFIEFQGPAVADAEIEGVSAVLRAVPGLVRALLHTPAAAHDPYLDDGAPPPLVLELYFDDIAALEAACGSDGSFQALARFASHGATQQAMLMRPYPVDDAAACAEPCCTYLVAYTGEAEDLNAWLAHYLAHHPAIMRRFPGIRGIEICSRLDCCSFLPFPRVNHMQRNKVVFDSPQALTAALASPVRHEMRADFRQFPPYRGGNTHFPMITRTLHL